MAAACLRILLWLFLCQSLALALASPSQPEHLRRIPQAQTTIKDPTGTIEVLGPSNAIVTQGTASDGSGLNFSPPALIWIVFCFFSGVPIGCAGIRGWRFTTGTAIGLASAVCGWAAIINTESSNSISDLLLTAIVMAFFFLGFMLGVFEFARLGAIAALGIAGGVAIGVRLTLIRAGLLIQGSSLFVLNWVIIVIFGAAGGLVLIWRQRLGLLVACASAGTFLTFLGVDLLLNKQIGMSSGLRLLFDRNEAHVAAFVSNPYTAPFSTKMIITASLGLIPFLAYGQHRIFPQPFTRKPEQSDDELGINFPTTQEQSNRLTFMALWEGAKGYGSRFSL